MKELILLQLKQKRLWETNMLSTADASKSGVAQEALQNAARRGSKVMTEQEARQILGKYEHLFESNAKNGSFYIQSKVHRAKECLEGVHRSKGEGPSSQDSV
ncbi:hypothetical protein JRO89_XS03G0137600 [Xanthoceras sorbifolium]|uniref:Mitochondrial import inner membrane translocase subunit Tim16 n=1 Tax=Xanthoceras sorbifolium TaxID=99658 RepID=A0ABQ8I9R7_9ROSI|nr:hypothetical protein JRO89_XS03G0137600 [Xanthoceras sorbifolium]